MRCVESESHPSQTQGVAAARPLHRRLNELPLCDAIDIPVVLPPEIAECAPEGGKERARARLRIEEVIRRSNSAEFAPTLV